jgi:hypothetical protein
MRRRRTDAGAPWRHTAWERENPSEGRVRGNTGRSACYANARTSSAHPTHAHACPTNRRAALIAPTGTTRSLHVQLSMLRQHGPSGSLGRTQRMLRVPMARRMSWRVSSAPERTAGHGIPTDDEQGAYVFGEECGAGRRGAGLGARGAAEDQLWQQGGGTPGFERPSAWLRRPGRLARAQAVLAAPARKPLVSLKGRAVGDGRIAAACVACGESTNLRTSLRQGDLRPLRAHLVQTCGHEPAAE